MSFARFSTDDVTGKIRGYVGEGEFTDDPLKPSAAPAWSRIPKSAGTAALHLRNGFEHHVAANLGHSAGRSVRSRKQVSRLDVHHHV